MRSKQATCDVTFTCVYNEMTAAIEFGYVNERQCGHPLAVQMMVILRPGTSLAEEETVSDMMVCPFDCRRWYFNVLGGARRAISIETTYMTLWLYGFRMVNSFYCTTVVRGPLLVMTLTRLICLYGFGSTAFVLWVNATTCLR